MQAVMQVRTFVSEYRWPIFIVGILLMSITAQGILVYVATRPDAPAPIENYYQRSLQWDADEAVVEASRALGWSLGFDIPRGDEYVPGARRPVDLQVTDRDGAPVTGLKGRLVAVRPADTRLHDEGTLVELPQAPGRYRTVVRLDAPGLWELRIDATYGTSRFVHTERVTVEGAPAKK